jgi:hypothetical protein
MRVPRPSRGLRHTRSEFGYLVTSKPPTVSQRVRRPFTGRALVLGAVLVLLVVLLAAPLHHYLAARSALQQSIAQRDSGQRQLQQLQ